MAVYKSKSKGLRGLLKAMSLDQRATFLLKYARLHHAKMEKYHTSQGYVRWRQRDRKPTIREKADACLDSYWDEIGEKLGE